ncbi:hypothetical protein [Emticicia fluvialis]|uniref:hypothetical protein n=1 Tax=Emticicia fluvialis TaxID=2974474 RepID=UPI0021666298|nr:hypothetical protein [Emticicia fluvialis]
MLEAHQFNPVLDKEFLLENYDTAEYLSEVMGDFLALMPEEMAEIQEALIDGDKDRLVKKIHAISSAVGFVGGIRLSDKMKAFEYKAKNDAAFNIANDETRALVTEITDFISIIKEEYTSLN